MTGKISSIGKVNFRAPFSVVLRLGFSITLAALAGCGGGEVGPDKAQPATNAQAAAGTAKAPTTPPTTDDFELPASLSGRMIAYSREYPWSALGRLNTGGRGFCSATLIGQDRVLASASCLTNRRTGKYWHPSDLHFVAGYQQDSFVASSPVARIDVAPGYNPGAGASLANLTANWALVTLQQPIGNETGWLGVTWVDPQEQAAIDRGQRPVLLAGYRRDWAHSVTVQFGCPNNRNLTSAGATATCSVLPGEQDLPRFLFEFGQLRVLGNQYIPALSERHRFQQAAGASNSGSVGKGPKRGATDPLPRRSVSKLLRQLGYLRTPENIIDERATRKAIRTYQAQSGQFSTGLASQALLGTLIEEVRRRGR